jgi:hypothetical protein
VREVNLQTNFFNTPSRIFFTGRGDDDFDGTITIDEPDGKVFLQGSLERPTGLADDIFPISRDALAVRLNST